MHLPVKQLNDDHQQRQSLVTGLSSSINTIRKQHGAGNTEKLLRHNMKTH